MKETHQDQRHHQLTQLHPDQEYGNPHCKASQKLEANPGFSLPSHPVQSKTAEEPETPTAHKSSLVKPVKITKQESSLVMEKT